MMPFLVRSIANGGIRQQLTGSMNVGFINAGFMESVV
jgi:hypothetical protein